MEQRFMNEAIREAMTAHSEGEVPIGAVVVRDGEIIGRAHNEIERRTSATAHAEMLAIEDAARTIGDWRLDGCVLYVTVEPCHMCMSAAYLSRMSQVIYGASNPRGGACGSVDDFHEAALHHHHIAVRGGVCEEACQRLLKDFFQGLRIGDDTRRDARAG